MEAKTSRDIWRETFELFRHVCPYVYLNICLLGNSNISTHDGNSLCIHKTCSRWHHYSDSTHCIVSSALRRIPFDTSGVTSAHAINPYVWRLWITLYIPIHFDMVSFLSCQPLDSSKDAR